MQQQQNNKNKDILRGMPESAADSQEWTASNQW